VSAAMQKSRNLYNVTKHSMLYEFVRKNKEVDIIVTNSKAKVEAAPLVVEAVPKLVAKI
jgi:hypothetical protein